jgi:hypothetical protein
VYSWLCGHGVILSAEILQHAGEEGLREKEIAEPEVVGWLSFIQT